MGITGALDPSRNAEIAGGKVSFRPLCVFYKPVQYEVCHWSLQAHPEVGHVVFNCIIVSRLQSRYLREVPFPLLSSDALVTDSSAFTTWQRSIGDCAESFASICI